MEKVTYAKIVGGALTGLISALFGTMDAFFYGLLFCISADYVTGILAAVYEQKLDSRVGFRGVLKKIVILTIVSLSHFLGELTEIPALRDLVIGFYIANESLSILENATRMQIPCTDKLKDVLKQLKDK